MILIQLLNKKKMNEQEFQTKEKSCSLTAMQRASEIFRVLFWYCCSWTELNAVSHSTSGAFTFYSGKFLWFCWLLSLNHYELSAVSGAQGTTPLSVAGQRILSSPGNSHFVLQQSAYPSCLISLAQWLATAIIAEVLPNQKKQEFGLFLELIEELYQLFSIFAYSHIQQRGTEHRYYKSDWQKLKAAKKQICRKRRFCFKCESLVAVAPQCTADAVRKESSVQHWCSAGQYGIACLLWQISSWYACSTPAKGVCSFVMSAASFFW